MAIVADGIMGGDGETSESCLFPASWPGRSRLEGRSPAPGWVFVKSRDPGNVIVTCFLLDSH